MMSHHIQERGEGFEARTPTISQPARASMFRAGRPEIGSCMILAAPGSFTRRSPAAGLREIGCCVILGRLEKLIACLVCESTRFLAVLVALCSPCGSLLLSDRAIFDKAVLLVQSISPASGNRPSLFRRANFCGAAPGMISPVIPNSDLFGWRGYGKT
jgi:hypothetical protein